MPQEMQCSGHKVSKGLIVDSSSFDSLRSSDHLHDVFTSLIGAAQQRQHSLTFFGEVAVLLALWVDEMLDLGKRELSEALGRDDG